MRGAVLLVEIKTLRPFLSVNSFTWYGSMAFVFMVVWPEAEGAIFMSKYISETKINGDVFI